MDTSDRPFDDSLCPCSECRQHPQRTTQEAPLAGVAVNRTPWALDCPLHGLVHLTNHEYNRQTTQGAGSSWTCPLCHQAARLNRDELETYRKEKLKQREERRRVRHDEAA